VQLGVCRKGLAPVNCITCLKASAYCSGTESDFGSESEWKSGKGPTEGSTPGKSGDVMHFRDHERGCWTGSTPPWAQAGGSESVGLFDMMAMRTSGAGLVHGSYWEGPRTERMEIPIGTYRVRPWFRIQLVGLLDAVLRTTVRRIQRNTIGTRVASAVSVGPGRLAHEGVGRKLPDSVLWGNALHVVRRLQDFRGPPTRRFPQLFTSSRGQD